MELEMGLRLPMHAHSAEEGTGYFEEHLGRKDLSSWGSQTPPEQDRAQFTTGTSLKKLPKRDFPQRAGAPHKRVLSNH